MFRVKKKVVKNFLIWFVCLLYLTLFCNYTINNGGLRAIAEKVWEGK